jgi:hypothetical protein
MQSLHCGDWLRLRCYVQSVWDVGGHIVDDVCVPVCMLGVYPRRVVSHQLPPQLLVPVTASMEEPKHAVKVHLLCPSSWTHDHMRPIAAKHGLLPPAASHELPDDCLESLDTLRPAEPIECRDLDVENAFLD